MPTLAPFVSDVCPPSQRREVLAILYQNLPADRRQRQIDRMLSTQEPAQQAIAQGGLLACFDGPTLAGGMLTLSSAGRVCMAWPPRADERYGGTQERAIWQSLLQRCAQRAQETDARFVQLLADDASPTMDEILREEGFVHLTQLVYARRAVEPAEQVPPAPSSVEFVPYTDERHGVLLDILQRSYEQSLDCPELTGIRTMEDVFRSHQGHGAILPDRWWLARDPGGWLGCLLLSAGVGDRVIEISYVALVPEARGRGLGRVLTREAIRLAAREDFEAVVLAVDGRNGPALAMYEDEGFVPWDIRDVYLRLIESADGRTSLSVD
jgi:GNAT superfamily N-acetyltransferase